jgi:hypothetical protein
MKTIRPIIPGLLLIAVALAATSAADAAPAETKQPARGVVIEVPPIRTVAPPAVQAPLQVLPVGPLVALPAGPPPRALLRGFVDLHTHPMSSLGFGGKLLYGGVDVGSLLPADPDCNLNVRAVSVNQALGHDMSTHAGADLLHNPFPNHDCRDTLRATFVHVFQSLNKANDPADDSAGFPLFADWPKWDDITHQKMWVDWIRRSYVGGLRVMVALAVNNKTTADSVAGPGDFATDDKTSADMQLNEIKGFVGRHLDFMEIAFTSADLYRIVSANKLAVVLGVEIDNIGNLGTNRISIAVGPSGNPASQMQPVSPAEISAEIGRLFAEGVRYIFPIHVTDNALGGTAAYEDTFNLSNLREAGHYWALGCAPANDGIMYRYRNPDQFNLEDLQTEAKLMAFAAAKLSFLANLGAGAPVPAGCPEGMRNTQGLTPLGVFAVKEMMRRGMLIDIDHMSELAADTALSIAEGVPSPGYPLNSGHAGLRCQTLGTSCNERSLTVAQYHRIGTLHGMAGIGSANAQPYQWKDMYTAVTQAMGPNGVAGFGTDTNGFALGMPPPDLTRTALVNTPAYNACVANVQASNQCGALPPNQKPACAQAVRTGEASCKAQNPQVTTCVQGCAHVQGPIQYSSAFPVSALGNRSWDYNAVGVAHYGMLPDFLLAVRSLPGGANMIDNNLMYGADYFFETWRLSEVQSAKVGP